MISGLTDVVQPAVLISDYFSHDAVEAVVLISSVSVFLPTAG